MDAESPALEDTKADSELSIADDTPPNEDRPPATKPTPFSGRFLDRSEAAAKCRHDFDGGLIGSVVVGELERLSGPLITWTVWDSSRFSNGESDLINAVIDEQCWVAVSVNQGSSAKLEAALTGNTTASGSYNGSTAITAYGVEARNENALCATFCRLAVADRAD
ncbi:hypothetical protein H0H92_001904 [Tricholoma furcatifolium]|nr:hypothetical protein H0H92_001904 [Tricholoma furcatifolium]